MKFHTTVLVALSLLLLFSGCTSDNSVAQVTLPASISSTDSIYWFRLSDYPRPRIQRFRNCENRCDTVVDVYYSLDSMRDSMVEYQRNIGGAVLGYTILTKDGGQLFQTGFGDTTRYVWKFSKPFYSELSKMQVGLSLSDPLYSAYPNSGKEYFDTLDLTTTSKGGRIQQWRLMSTMSVGLTAWGNYPHCPEVAMFWMGITTGDTIIGRSIDRWCPGAGLVLSNYTNGIRYQIF
jgi:hypothetical protein